MTFIEADAVEQMVLDTYQKLGRRLAPELRLASQAEDVFVESLLPFRKCKIVPRKQRTLCYGAYCDYPSFRYAVWAKVPFSASGIGKRNCS
jgi:hypothetical protein